MPTTLKQKREAAKKREIERQKKIANRKANIGKKGYDKQGVLTIAGKKAQDKKAKNKKLGDERVKERVYETNRRNEAIKSRIQSKKQVENIRETMGLNRDGSKKSTPKKAASQKKREKIAALKTPKVSGVNEVTVNKASASKKIKENKKPESKYFDDPNISNKNKRIAKRSEKRKERQDDRAERIALRKDITFDQAKELQGQRRANRKQFLKNFAANLAGVEMNKGEFNTKDYENYKKNNDENAESNIVSDQQKSNKIDTENNTKRYKSLFESMANAPNSTLGNMSYLDDLEV